MRDARAAAALHVQQMTTRVKDQESLVDRLKSEGGDASQEIERLSLLRRALEEMLLYLPRMIPNENDPAPPRTAEVEQMISWWRGEPPTASQTKADVDQAAKRYSREGHFAALRWVDLAAAVGSGTSTIRPNSIPRPNLDQAGPLTCRGHNS
jgi:hypothetical protein